MAVFRVNKNKNYTAMSNIHLRDSNLSLKAKGLLSVMLALPENWDYSVVGLASICKEAKNTINEILKELQKNNYLERKRIYKNGKIVDWEYVIYENNLHRKNEDIENQDIENQDIENWSQLNIKQLNKDELITNTKKENIKEICDYLNERAKTNYKPTTKTTIQSINGRMAEGYTIADFKSVIDKKCGEWLGTEMEKYLTPDTLFRPANFEKYLNQKIVNPKKELTNDDIFGEQYMKDQIEWLKSECNGR